MVFAIYINGPSSAGKSTLVKALQAAAPEPLYTMGIDLLIRQMLPPKLFLEPEGDPSRGVYWKNIIDPTGRSVPYAFMGEDAMQGFRGLVEASKGMLSAGNSLVIDDVAILGSDQVKIWKEALVDFPTVFVGVHSPLEVLEERERRRGDRVIGSARGQFFRVHEGIEYDIEVDTNSLSTKQIVSLVLEELLVSS